MSPRQKRYKIFLDEMFPRRQKLPGLNQAHDVKHILHDLKKGGVSDDEVIAIAKRQERILVTKNIKHFQGKCRGW